MDKLASDQIEAQLASLPEWTLSGESLQRTIGFDDFQAAMGFVNKVAEVAEEVQHHPDILVRYAKVSLTLTTHDAGGLTQRDFDMASTLERVISGA